MTSQDQRACQECDRALPEDARRTQKYCSDTCQRRAGSRRFRAKRQAEKATSQTENEQLREVLEHWKAQYRKRNEQLREHKLKIRRLQNALRTAEHQVEVAANEQALRTRAVREELAMSQSEVAMLKRNWSVRSAADDETVTKLRSDLATVTDEYNELATKYRQLTGAAKSAAEERKNLQGIVRQWDYLCKRLHVATKGRPRNDSDKKILATWSQFRKQVRK